MLWVLASALILLVVVPPLAIRIPAVQTLVKNAAVNILSDQLGARVAIGAVRLRWYLDLSLQDVQLDDLRGAPLLRVGEARVDIGSLRLRKRILVVASLRLDRPGVMILRRAGEEDTNLQFLLDRFAAGDTAAAPAWTFRLDALEVTGGSFVYEDEARGRVDYGIDWDHLRVDSLYLSLKDYHLQGDTHVFRLDHLALREGSGFLLDTLTGDMSLSEQVLQARRLLVRTAGARLDLDLAFTYDSFGAFNHFIDSVYVRAALRPSRLDMAELAYFAPELRTMHNRLTLSGNLKGYVSAFRARELEIGMGQDLILAADLDVNGLPEVKETFVDARIRQLELQASSLERFRLPESSRFGEMPAILHRLGTTRIRGVFTGFYNDFVAQADVQAAQGSVNTDLVLRQEPGGMTYRGSISSPAFDLGGLLELRGMLGSLRLDMEVEGRGTDWSTLDLKMQGVVDSLELQGETFTRIDIHGMMEGKRYTGQLAVDDDLLGLDFNGEVDLEGEVPRFDVMASVHHARLDRLTRNAFGKYLSAKGEVMLNFSGDRLDQLEGTMGIEGLELADTAERLRCRSLLLSFEPDDRRYKAVRLRSDLADLDIEGSFRFEELYHGLGYSLQRLLPTAGWKAAIPAPEVGHYANLELTLYETAPLSAIFFPGLYFAFGT
ncbi:MAG TPA: hypothetical protein P5248_06640, partial [Bacteroidales bacterium]|nr:hypothetical protein [Bacteroidales bacterium]